MDSLSSLQNRVKLWNAKVCDLVDGNGIWNWNLLSSWLPMDMMQKISAILPPDSSAGVDKRLGIGGTSEHFSIAVMYNNLRNFRIDNDSWIWKKIWKLNVPERVKCFIWMMRHNCLLTNYTKSKMGLGSAMCGFCGCIIETMLHVMRDCSLTMPLWLNVVHVSSRDDFFKGDLNDWIEFNLTANVGWNLDMKWQNFWATTCHCLWYLRNKEYHEENYSRPSHPTQHDFKYTRDYREAYETNKMVVKICHNMVFIGWKPPIEGWVKLNTNGSCKQNGRAGCGGIIRGSDGEWLGGFAKSIGVCNAYMAELWKVYEGLRYARVLGFRAIELNVDSLVVVNALMHNGRRIPVGRSLVEKIRRMMELM